MEMTTTQINEMWMRLKRDDAMLLFWLKWDYIEEIFGVYIYSFTEYSRKTQEINKVA